MDICSAIKERFSALQTEENFSLARHTTLGCGGNAAVCAEPSGAEEAAALLEFLSERSIPYYFMGAGANILPQDGFYDGVVVRFRRMKTLIRVDQYIYAGAGVTGGALCRFARREGIGGFEPFTGIPMTVGGACVMNAGIPQRHISDIVIQVVALKGSALHVFSVQECHYGEKSSVFRSGIPVIGALFRAEPSPQEEIALNSALYRKRRSALPKGRSMGCVFVNPPGQSAGAIIEGCGLKGMRLGGACVSGQHANFILNEEGTASDVAALISLVKTVVSEKTGIRLREEICRFGSYPTSDPDT